MNKSSPSTATAAPQGDGSTLSTPMTDRFAECVFGVELVNASLARQLERDRASLIAALRLFIKHEDDAAKYIPALDHAYDNAINVLYDLTTEPRS